MPAGLRRRVGSSPVRVAFVGKGGSGKSTIAGLLARRLAAAGEPVLAIDSDPMPGLAFALGIPASDAGLPDDAVIELPEEQRPPRFRLRPGLDPVAAVERYAAVAPDGVRFLQFGKLRGHASQLFRSQVAFREIVTGLGDGPWHLVGDLPAGTRQAFFGWGAYADTYVVVVEPTAKALLTARRLARLASGDDPPRIVAVVNKAERDGDAATVAARTGLEVVGSVPRDRSVGDAERDGLAPYDVAPDGPAARAVASLLDALVQQEAGT